MKQKLLSLTTAVLTIGLLFSTAIAQSYTLNQYFPLGQGNTLVFAETGEESKSIALQTVLGIQLVGLVPTQTMWYWESKSLLGRKGSSLAWNFVQGLRRHKDVYFQGIAETGYTIYDSPDILLPRNMEVGEILQGSSSYTRHDASDTEIATGTLERELTLAGVEEVTVRAGTFTGSLKFLETVFWEESPDTYGSREKTFWLAPGVGLIKWNEAVSASVPGEGESAEESSWELFLGYVGGEPILPDAPPEADFASLDYGLAR